MSVRPRGRADGAGAPGYGGRRALLGAALAAVLLGLCLPGGGGPAGRVTAAGPVGAGSARTSRSSVALPALPAGLAPVLARALRQGTAAPAVTWSQRAEFTPISSVANDQFGISVAVRGSTALVGAPGKNSGTGAAYVFVRSGTTWTQQAELIPSDGTPSDYFGSSVALSGSTALVGAPDKNLSTGAAYVFVRSGTTWTQQAKLTASDGATFDGFGSSVALSGSTALVGADGKSPAAYVFVRSGTTWSQQAELTASDGAPNDNFGASVAVSGRTALVGAPFKNSDIGAAYAFMRSGTTGTAEDAPAD